MMRGRICKHMNGTIIDCNKPSATVGVSHLRATSCGGGSAAADYKHDKTEQTKSGHLAAVSSL